jgi:hypothetical protein
MLKVFVLTVMLAGQPTPDEFYFVGLAACGDTGDRIEAVDRRVEWWHCLSSEILEVY